MSATESHKSGFIVIVGPTNAGKSTLLNRMLGQKVSIVSPKQQTTWHGVRGVLRRPNAELVFTDTPGFQRHQEKVARMLNRVAERHAVDSEQQLWVFDVSNPRVLKQLEGLKKKIESIGSADDRVVALNKIDRVPKPALLPLIAKFAETGLFRTVVPISSQSGDNIASLVGELETKLPEGPAMYPGDVVTDRSPHFRIAELVREKVYRYTHEEVPYSVWVNVEHESRETRVPTFHVTLHVDSASRRGILIGRGGEKLKAIGTAARRDVERLIGEQVCLKLFVHVDEGWKDDARKIAAYLEMGD